jgi:hypothetical protein
VFDVSPLEENDSLKLTDLYRSDTINLYKTSYAYPTQNIYYSDDTIINQAYSFINDCKNFPLKEIKYIGLKLTVNNIEKLGWIKLCLIRNQQYNTVMILKSAIQK